MKKLLLFLAYISLLSVSFAETAAEANREQRMQWWTDARFGMFIHWGVYSVPGGLYHGHPMNRGGAEWIMNRSKIPVAEYQGYAKEFNPVKFDADAWVAMARDAGMKYIVITAKHHDGFAMFKSEASKWNIVDATPYGKDVLKQLAEACRKQGIRLGFYYSQAQDWNNPGGAAARKVSAEGWDNPNAAAVDDYTASHNGHWDPAQTTATMSQYIDNVAVPQVKELLTNYGDVAVLWWDTPTGMTDAYAAKLNALLSLQPNIITNDRLKRDTFPGDYLTPEQKIPNLDELDSRGWETCMTMNGSWGYKSYDHNWKSTETLVRNLIDIASKGGNLLLNVGPMSTGEFPAESVTRLREIGAWTKENGEAIYGTRASPFGLLPWGRCTVKAGTDKTTLYLFVFDWPKNGVLALDGIPNQVASASLLATGASLESNTQGDHLEIRVPTQAPNAIASVIKLEVRGTVAAKSSRGPKAGIKSGPLD